ncbi:MULTISPECIES: hypothetical protein [unclassified Streptomyces]|uniref:hypothetical protein n=1 Tax=unclassified Streptomyces TaxID=2593676 RepID=UPI00344CC4AD
MLTPAMGAAAWVLAGAAVSGAAVRLLLGLLAAHAARTALRPAAPSESAHRLAVLRALLDELRSHRR